MKISKQTHSYKLTAVLVVGVVLGWALASLTPTRTLHADERKRKDSKVAFQSGSERSVLVLEKISQQIDGIDKRLERIEIGVTGKKSVTAGQKR